MVFVGSSECDINIEVGSYSVNVRKFMILILFWVILIKIHCENSSCSSTHLLWGSLKSCYWNFFHVIINHQIIDLALT